MKLEPTKPASQILAVAVLLACIMAVPVAAQVMKKGLQPLDPVTFAKSELWITAQNESPEEFRSLAPGPVAAEFERLQALEGVRWTARFDRVTGKPAHLEGEGIPWIPGTANRLSADAFGLPPSLEGKDIPVSVVGEKAREFLARYPDLIGVNPDSLVLNEIASGPVLDYLYNIDFDLVHFGIPVERAHVVFRLNHGNLVQLGQDFICDSLAKLDPTPSISLATAWEIVWGFAGREGDEVIVEPGRLRILPVSTPDVLSHALVAPGSGLGYRLSYILSFRRPEVLGTWEARVDAHTGEILSFLDANEYGHIEGGAYQTDNFPAVTIMPFPHADYGSGVYADAAGNFSGTSGTSTLNGKYVRILSGATASEGCSSSTSAEISLASDGTGNINFSTSTGKDCTTPGVGGVGNTHAARTQYWNVTQIKLKALTYMPTNNWLQGKLTDYVNRVAYCNAYWDGSALNFFKSASGCGNLGELPGVSLHEWAHGMDANDGRASADRTTGESYGDFSGTLQTHASCSGMGALSSKCSGYGDACRTCTGVRDMDYAAHSSGTPQTPDMFDNSSGFRCIQYGYPNSSYPGLCRYEGHCESGVSSQALWDLAARDLPGMGIDTVTAWQIMDRLWYASRPSQQSAFNCPSITTTDGSNTGSFYNIFRTVDDCDGNLANGTPHANAIFDAMARHKMAVGADGDATNQNQTTCCPTLATPTLSGSAGSCQNNLSWGSITNAAKYKLYRNETGCSMGFTLIATVNSPGTSYADTNVSEGTAYYYRLQAVGTSDACTSAMSNCATVTAAACGGSCTAPGAPNLTAATGTCTGVNLTWTAGTGTTSSYNVYRVAGACGGSYAKIAGPITGTTYSDTTTVAGTSYAYIVRGACDAGGTTESANSNCRTASMLATPALPAAPTVTDDCTGLIVSWTAISGAASYDVMRRTGGCGNNSWGSAQTGVTGTTWTDTAATVGSTYGYYIVAVNACGSAGDKAYCTAGTHTASGAPSAPTGLTATGACAAVNLSWTASSGATSYNVLRTTNSNCSTGLAQIGTSATTAYSDTTAVAGTTYYYVVQAVSACGTSGNSSCANAARLQTPSAPTGLTATGSCTAVDLSWTASSGATSYNILRTTNSNCTTGLAQIGTSATTTYSDTSAVAGTTYYYVVQAVNTCGTSANSTCANAARTAAPAAPTGLSAAGDCAGINLGWTAASGANSYNVLRTTNSNCTTGLAQIGTSATTAYSDTGAVAGTTYYYVVQAVNTCGTSANSTCANSVRLATPAAPGGPTFTNVSCSTLTVNWGAVSGATAYDLYRRTGACGTGSTIATNLTGTTYNDTGLTASTQYSYYLVAKNTCGSSANGTCTSQTTTGGPTAPAAPTVTDDCAGLAVSWAAASGATSYNVYRRSNGCGTNSWSQVATGVTLLTWTDTGAALGTTYGYYIEAVNACGTATSGNGACTAGTHSLQTPPAPGSVTATGTCADVTVTWGAVSGATSYNVLRGTVCGTVVTTFTGATSPYHETTAVAGTTYQYWVVAVNSCGNSANSSCASAARLASPTPTITGASANTCPATTVLLTTESGQSSYQWYRGGSPISGANTYQYTVTQTGDYTVSYSNAGGCSGTSVLKTVTITLCVPDIAYSANGTWTQVYGNGDSVVDPGETWDVTVTLQNSGTGNATNVSASLTATGATFCTGTASYGPIAIGGTATGTFRFVVSSSFTCGNNLSFNVVNKTSTEGSYPNENGVFTRQVGAMGSGTPEVASTADFTAPASSTSTKTLSPNLTIAGASCQSAVATYTANTQFAKVTSALLRHVGSGTTVALSLPTGNGVAVSTTVTSFYQAHGAGTYQMEWVTGNKAVNLAAISLTVTPTSVPVCNIWSGQSCLAGPTPKPVPDGQWVAGTPLTASKVDSTATQVTLGWGVACPSANYNILYGNGSQVSSVTTSGSECGLGTSGAYSWTSAPSISGGETFVWWLIVGTDGSATEGSWGRNSAGAERNGGVASNRCGYTVKNTSGTCP